MDYLLIVLFVTAGATVGLVMYLAYLSSTNFLNSIRHQRRIHAALNYAVISALCMLVCAVLMSIFQAMS